jgi:hypothetical protein
MASRDDFFRISNCAEGLASAGSSSSRTGTVMAGRTPCDVKLGVNGALGGSGGNNMPSSAIRGTTGAEFAWIGSGRPDPCAAPNDGDRIGDPTGSEEAVRPRVVCARKTPCLDGAAPRCCSLGAVALRIRPMLIFFKKPQRFPFSADSSFGEVTASSNSMARESGREVATDVGRESDAELSISRRGDSAEASAHIVKGIRLRSPLRLPTGPPRGRLSNRRPGTSSLVGNGALVRGRENCPSRDNSSALFILRMVFRPGSEVVEIFEEDFCMGDGGLGRVESSIDR